MEQNIQLLPKAVNVSPLMTHYCLWTNAALGIIPHSEHHPVIRDPVTLPNDSLLYICRILYHMYKSACTTTASLVHIGILH